MRLHAWPNRMLLGAVSLALCAGAWVYAATVPEIGSGRALYQGEGTVLQARLAGHDDELPAEAARCINCHEGAGAIGPQLDARLLLQPIARRGGPPSQYDEAAFCRLLRDGVDPAFVQLPREMPRYQLADADCRALWNFLTHS